MLYEVELEKEEEEDMNSSERRELRYQRRKARREASKKRNNRKADNFEKVFSYDNLYNSYLMCRRNVRWKSSTQRYIANAVLNVYKAYYQLHNGTFRSNGFYEFDLFERGKARHIKSVNMEERVVQRCVCDYSLIPVLRRTFIYDNGASMHRKGYSFAVKRFNRHLQWHIHKHGSKGYILLFDFSSYFDSIPHDLIFKILDKEYSDKRLVKLVKHFVEMFGDKGIGLGSQVSQVLALAAANELDHFIKEELHIKCYGRYMDDGYLIHESKEYLQECLVRIQEKCNELGLILSTRKTRIAPIRKKFTWLKISYFVTETGRIVKRVWHKSVVRMRRKLKKLKKKVDAGILKISDVKQSFNSWKSHTKGLRIYWTMKNMVELMADIYGREVIA